MAICVRAPRFMYMVAIKFFLSFLYIHFHLNGIPLASLSITLSLSLNDDDNGA